MESSVKKVPVNFILYLGHLGLFLSCSHPVLYFYTSSKGGQAFFPVLVVDFVFGFVFASSVKNNVNRV